jgi:hypothetical protein
MTVDNDRVSDVLHVLSIMRSDFTNVSHLVDVTRSRKTAVNAVAESGIENGRFKNGIVAAEKSIRDACSCRLGFQRIREFDDLAEQWFRKGSMRLRDVVFQVANNLSRKNKVIEFFGADGSIRSAVHRKSTSPLGNKPVAKSSESQQTINAEGIRLAKESDIEGLKTEARLIRTKRSRKLRDAAFNAAQGVCCVCDRDFSKLLNGRGVRVLQVHHRDQLAAREAPSVTKQTDLAVVCANCHLLLHLDSKEALSIQDLRDMLQADGFYK